MLPERAMPKHYKMKFKRDDGKSLADDSKKWGNLFSITAERALYCVSYFERTK
jgi:hypothetical protein